MAIVQPSFNLNDPDLYITPKILMWQAGNYVQTSNDISTDFVVPEGHFWEVVRLTVSSLSTTQKYCAFVMRNGNHYYDTDFDTHNQHAQFHNYIGYGDTPAITSASNNPYPNSCLTFADKNLPIYMPSGTMFQMVAESHDVVDCYMAYKDYQVS